MAFEVLPMRDKMARMAMVAMKIEIHGNFRNMFWRWSQSISDGLDGAWEDERERNYGSYMFGLSNEGNIGFIFFFSF